MDNRTKKIFELRQIARTDDWQLVHGNLMTILMIFFLVLFSYYHMKKGGDYEQGLESIQNEFGGKLNMNAVQRAKHKDIEEDVARKISQIGNEEGMKKFTRVETDRQKIKIIFPDPVIFSPGSSDLNPDTIWILGEIAAKLRMLPDNKIIIEGHTDNIPIGSGAKYASNWELSLARSLSIVHYLAEVEGIDPKMLVPIGYGEYRPLYANDTLEHRAQNRRIEISIIKKA